MIRPEINQPEVESKNGDAKESEELVVHFVSSPEKFEDPAKKNFHWWENIWQEGFYLKINISNFHIGISDWRNISKLVKVTVLYESLNANEKSNET